MTAILGISAFYHDSAAALVVDGEVVAAAQEERFTRKKHDEAFPVRAIGYCLAEAGLGAKDLDWVGFYDKPVLKSGRLLDTYLSFAPVGFKSFLKSVPIWLRQKLHLPREMRSGLGGEYDKAFVFLEHHESHAASAFFPSPFEEAAVMTVDGVGEWATASFARGSGNRVELLRELRFPHSLGLLYSAFTYFTGFKVNADEYKLMGLAPYGEPLYVDLILDKLMDLKEDGSFRLDLSYFNYCQGLTMTSPRMDALFGGPPRRPEGPTTKREMDIAASIQKVTEEVVLRMARALHADTGLANLCLAGGVALNCVGNGRLLREGPFENVWIQPAAGDAGGALGTALFIWHQLLEHERTPSPSDSQHGSLLGPQWGDDDIRRILDEQRAVYTTATDDAEIDRAIAAELDAGRVIGWFQGRMEFGPRALGARSILGDPRRAEMQRIINSKVKFREGFRPFAPAVLRERAHEWFVADENLDSPYMLMVTQVHPDKLKPLPPELANASGIDKLKADRSEVGAVTHVDNSARVQTLDADRAPRFRSLVAEFERRTGCPIVVNTSFNLGWDPIVCTPKDAYRTFMQSDIDVLCMGRQILRKSEQPATIGARVESAASSGNGSVALAADPYLERLLQSPCHGAELRRDGGALVCTECGHGFGSEDGIRQMFWPHEQHAGTDVTDVVKSFYEETPFPNYDDHDTLRSLIDRSRRGVYARILDDSIPFNSRVLEVGCGTGQLTNFLGIACRQVVGTDMCLNSLRLADAFRREQGLERVRFAQMNLFRPCFKDEQFDVILCNGVLHHTGDPRGGFEGFLRMLKPGGHIVIGLYNTYGRLMTDARRFAMRATGGRLPGIDPYLRSLRSKDSTKDKVRAWMNDQYFHPHESKHTIGEVQRWFAENGLEFVRGIPGTTAREDGLATDDLFRPAAPGGTLDHGLVQLKLLATSGWEGGLFSMIARKPE